MTATKPFPPSWQDDPDMLDVIAGLEEGEHRIMIVNRSSSSEHPERFYLDAQHTCVEWRGRMYIIWSIPIE